MNIDQVLRGSNTCPISLYNVAMALSSNNRSPYGGFEIITPFPMRIYKDMSKTLEDEKLYPNAVVQIREI